MMEGGWRTQLFGGTSAEANSARSVEDLGAVLAKIDAEDEAEEAEAEAERDAYNEKILTAPEEELEKLEASLARRARDKSRRAAARAAILEQIEAAEIRRSDAEMRAHADRLSSLREEMTRIDADVRRGVAEAVRLTEEGEQKWRDFERTRQILIANARQDLGTDHWRGLVFTIVRQRIAALFNSAKGDLS